MNNTDLNDELKKISVDGLKQLGDWIHQAKDFAVEQAPLFAQEYAKWYTVTNLIGAVTWFAVAGVCLWIATKGTKYMLKLSEEPNHSSDWYEVGVTCRIVASLACFITFLVGTSYLKDTAKGYYAPRVVLVEGIREIVKGDTCSCNK